MTDFQSAGLEDCLLDAGSAGSGNLETGEFQIRQRVPFNGFDIRLRVTACVTQPAGVPWLRKRDIRL